MYRLFAPDVSGAPGLPAPFVCPPESFYRLLSARFVFTLIATCSFAGVTVNDGARDVGDTIAHVDPPVSVLIDVQLVADTYEARTTRFGGGDKVFVPIEQLDVQPGWSITPYVNDAGGAFFHSIQWFVDDLALGSEREHWYGSALA